MKTRVFAWLPTLTPAEVEAYRALRALAKRWRQRNQMVQAPLFASWLGD